MKLYIHILQARNQAFLERFLNVIRLHMKLELSSIMQSTISMQSMLMLGGLGACPQEMFENQCS